MAKVSTKKPVNEIKMLAFRQLMSEGASQLDVRGRLGMATRTYFRYLAAYRRENDRRARPK